MIGLVEQFVALLHDAQARAIDVVEIEMRDAVGIPHRQIFRTRHQALLQKRGRGEIGHAALGRCHLPVPAGKRQREARVGEFVLDAGRAVALDLDIGEEAIHHGAQARVEIALERCLEQARQKHGGADEQDDGDDGGRDDEPEGE